MRGEDPVARRAAGNLAAVETDLAAARAEGDSERAMLLEALLSFGGDVLVYRPQLQHYAVLFGELEQAGHVAVVVPGVGDATDLRAEWIPGARNLYEAAPCTAVVLWKGYDNPADILRAAEGSIECTEDLVGAGNDLVAFVASLSLRPDQSITVVAHSFGSIVTGCALADCGLRVTDVVVAGSPGMTVDRLRQLHIERSHFFSEQAPGDVVAELGVFGSEPASPEFGGTRMETNAPGHEEVRAHSSYFESGSEALQNMAAVVTGHYARVERHRSSFAEVVGALVAWTLRLPAAPVERAGRRYRGPGFRLLVNTCRLVDFGASQTGNLITEALDESERILARFAHHVGAHPARTTSTGPTPGKRARPLR
jgi:pimeloyl-ACP methyl ester carboxylesterase